MARIVKANLPEDSSTAPCFLMYMDASKKGYKIVPATVESYEDAPQSKRRQKGEKPDGKISCAMDVQMAAAYGLYLVPRLQGLFSGICATNSCSKGCPVRKNDQCLKNEALAYASRSSTNYPVEIKKAVACIYAEIVQGDKRYAKAFERQKTMTYEQFAYGDGGRGDAVFNLLATELLTSEQEGDAKDV